MAKSFIFKAEIEIELRSMKRMNKACYMFSLVSGLLSEKHTVGEESQ